MIKDYKEIDTDREIQFKEIKELEDGIAILKLDKNITTLTPPLKCENIKIWKSQKKNQSENSKSDIKIKKFELNLILTQNEWRFMNFLSEVSDKSKKSMIERTQSYLFSEKNLNENYKNLFKESDLKNETEIISLPVREKCDLDIIKSYKNNYLSFIITFKGIIIKKGIFRELWIVEKIYKNDDNDSEYEYDFDDIQEQNLIHTNSKKTNEIENESDNSTTEQSSQGNTKDLKISDEKEVIIDSTVNKVVKNKIVSSPNECENEKRKKERKKKMSKSKKKKKIKIITSGGKSRYLN